ncbi:MAG: MlaD family protein [Planctomycetota bacterium]
MDENILKFRVGVFVVIAMCILGILVFLNSEGFVPQYIVYVKPTSAPGVTRNTPIRKNGILIGRVRRVSTEDDHVRLDLAINSGEKIYENETCSIGTESILGDAVVEFLTKSADERGPVVQEGDTISTVAIARNPLDFVDMFADLKPEISTALAVVQDAGKSVDEAGVGIRNLSDSIQNIFDQDDNEVKALLLDLRTMSQKAQAALDNFNRIFENVNRVVGDPELRNRVRDSLAELPKIFQEVRNTVTDTRDAIQAFAKVPDNINTNLENIKPLTESLKIRGPEILDQVKTSLSNVDEFVSEVRQFTSSLKNLQNSEGTIGKLLNDSEIYDSALATVKRIEEISIKLEPAINDLRMFADEIARDPGVIGVRGALDRRPSKTGYKGNAVGRDGGLFQFR